MIYMIYIIIVFVGIYRNYYMVKHIANIKKYFLTSKFLKFRTMFSIKKCARISNFTSASGMGNEFVNPC